MTLMILFRGHFSCKWPKIANFQKWLLNFVFLYGMDILCKFLLIWTKIYGSVTFVIKYFKISNFGGGDENQIWQGFFVNAKCQFCLLFIRDTIKTTNLKCDNFWKANWFWHLVKSLCSPCGNLSKKFNLNFLIQTSPPYRLKALIKVCE